MLFTFTLLLLFLYKFWIMVTIPSGIPYCRRIAHSEGFPEVDEICHHWFCHAVTFSITCLSANIWSLHDLPGLNLLVLDVDLYPLPYTRILPSKYTRKHFAWDWQQSQRWKWVIFRDPWPIWPITQLTHDPHDPRPMTHGQWPLHHFTLRMGRGGGVAWWYCTTLSVLTAKNRRLKLSLQLW